MLKLRNEFERVQVQLQLLTEYSNDLVARHDLEGKILEVSANCEFWLGFRPEELVGRSAYDLVHPDDVRTVQKHHQQVLEGTTEQVPVQFRLMTRIGEFIWGESIIRAVTPLPGRPLMELVSVTRDITTRLEAERVAESLRSNLAHVLRISSLGELASGLAHELSQPLAAITAYAVGASLRLAQQTVEQAEMQHWMDEISQLSRMASGILRSMRNFVKHRSTLQSEIDLPPLVSEVLSLLQSVVRLDGIDVQCDFAPILPRVYADNVQIQQVFLNLIRNGLESLGQTHAPGRQLSITISAPPANDEIEVRIADNGPGIPPEHRADIFRPFFSTKEGGVGLGLPISRSIVESHGGRLWAEFPDDGGVVFAFTLPSA